MLVAFNSEPNIYLNLRLVYLSVHLTDHPLTYKLHREKPVSLFFGVVFPTLNTVPYDSFSVKILLNE